MTLSVASTKATILRELGESHFNDSLFATDKVRLDTLLSWSLLMHTTWIDQSDLTTAAYKSHVQSKHAKAPMSEREEEAAAVRAAEGVEARGSESRMSHLAASGSVKGMKWTDEAEAAVRSLAEQKAGAVTLVRLLARFSFSVC